MVEDVDQYVLIENGFPVCIPFSKWKLGFYKQFFSICVILNAQSFWKSKGNKVDIFRNEQK